MDEEVGGYMRWTPEMKKLLNIFRPTKDGKKIVQLQVKNGKLEIKYEGGEKK